MENLKGLKILAYRSSKDDYLGVVTFFNPKLPQPNVTWAARPSVNVMFIYNNRGIRFDGGTGIEEYLEDNNLIDEFIESINEIINTENLHVV